MLLKMGVASTWDHDISILPGKVSGLSWIASELVSNIDILHEVSPIPAEIGLSYAHRALKVCIALLY
jgi:hypothetical protein